MPHALSCSFILLALAAARSENQEPAVTARDVPFVRRVGFHRSQNKALPESDVAATAVRRVSVAPIGQVGKDLLERDEVSLDSKENVSAPLKEATNRSLPQVGKIQEMVVVGGQGQIGHDGESLAAVHVERVAAHHGSSLRRLSSSIAQLLTRSAKDTRASRVAGVQDPYANPYMPNPYMFGVTTTAMMPYGGMYPQTTTGFPSPYAQTSVAALGYGEDAQIPVAPEEEDDSGMTTVIIVVAFAILIGALGLYLYRMWLTRLALENAPDTRGRLATDFHRDKFGDEAADAIADAKKNKSKYTRSEMPGQNNQHTDSEGEEEAPAPKRMSQSSTGGSNERVHSPQQARGPPHQGTSSAPSGRMPGPLGAGAQFGMPGPSRGAIQRSSEVGPARVNSFGRGVHVQRAHASFVHPGLHGKR